jgi:hypothetical protein
MTKQYRATIIRKDGTEEDWGFYDLNIAYGSLLLRTVEDFPVGQFDTILAPGEWREIRDTFVEKES